MVLKNVQVNIVDQKNNMNKFLVTEEERNYIKSLYNLQEEKTEKKIYVLVGPPSVGKSTWIKNTFKSEPYIISRDNIVDQVADELGWGYEDLFVKPKNDEELGSIHPKYGKVIESPPWDKFSKLSYQNVSDANGKVSKLFNQRIANAKNHDNIVVDLTNMTANARKAGLKAVEGVSNDYKKIAVVFKFKGNEDIIKKMAAKRNDELNKIGKGKNIPDSVYDQMFNSYQDVTPEEGFDDIIYVDNTDKFKDILNKNENYNQ